MRVRVVDSHTGGEPTRVVIDGGPALTGSFAARVEDLRRNHDHFRSAIVNEPRGSDVLVGALLTPPLAPGCTAGVIFFNNVGYLGMCGHGTIGTIVTLAWLGRIAQGEHRLETPVGVVTATLHDANTVSVRNVPAWRHARGVRVEVEGHGPVTGDIAWGGNWFFLCEDHGRRLALADAAALGEFCGRIRRALARAGITGPGGVEIDHVELADEARNFVLCPGGAYDRSPCGTGTSARLACLAADGRLAPGEVWRQTGITGSVFESRYERDGERIIPTITGQAWVTAEATLLMDAADPLAHGIRVAP
ncbi:MAG TPA: proline racemase family protein [Steroidobacteraceae bacterium]|nr:proline racemase family protein [Steroidobacteraceae bacterium]